MGAGAGAPGAQGSDPAYEWSNTKAGAPISFGTQNWAPIVGCTFPPDVSDHVVSGRDYINTTTKPGYVAFPYPHPIRKAYSILSVSTRSAVSTLLAATERLAVTSRLNSE